MAILWASEAHSPRDTPMVSIPTVLSASREHGRVQLERRFVVKEIAWGRRKQQKAENLENWLHFSYQLAVWFGALSVPLFPKYTMGKCGLGQCISNFHVHMDHLGLVLNGRFQLSRPGTHPV